MYPIDAIKVSEAFEVLNALSWLTNLEDADANNQHCTIGTLQVDVFRNNENNKR
jgi:hypothetical protein